MNFIAKRNLNPDLSRFLSTNPRAVEIQEAWLWSKVVRNQVKKSWVLSQLSDQHLDSSTQAGADDNLIQQLPKLN